METTSDLPDDAIPIGQAATLVRVHKSAVYRWALKGVIPSWRRGPGRRLLVSRADVLARLERVEMPGPAGPPTGREKAERRARNRKVLSKWKL